MITFPDTEEYLVGHACRIPVDAPDPVLLKNDRNILECTGCKKELP